LIDFILIKSESVKKFKQNTSVVYFLHIIDITYFDFHLLSSLVLRILANRSATQKSRLKKLDYIADLERMETHLQVYIIIYRISKIVIYDFFCLINICSCVSRRDPGYPRSWKPMVFRYESNNANYNFTKLKLK